MEIYPAIQGQLGTWRYYSTKMTARNLASNVNFASEVWDAKALDYWIQRSLSDSRAKGDIAKYLANHEDRFFNAIVVAAIEGNPKFFGISVDDDPQFALISDKKLMDAFGVLRFDGTQKYYALDGQHRLRAIQALINNETEHSAPAGFDTEEFPVLIVVQAEGEDREPFMKKYRRLFSHLNRYAKPMDMATTIIMEEDDAFAICTRRLIQDHEFFSWIGPDDLTRVRALKPKNMNRTEAYWTSIEAFYQMNINLLMAKHRETSGEWGTGSRPQIIKSFTENRPDDDVLEQLAAELSIYWDAILDEFPELYRDAHSMRTDLSEDVDDGREVRTNHMLFRPIGQELMCLLVRAKLDQKLPLPTEPAPESVKGAIRGFSSVEWRLHSPPWRNLLFVYDESTDNWRMRGENRKEALAVGERVMRYVLGIDTWSAEDLPDLKSDWRSLLIGCSNDEADEQWLRIEEQTDRYLSATEPES